MNFCITGNKIMGKCICMQLSVVLSISLKELDTKIVDK